MLGDLITVLLAPYDDTGAFSGRVRVSVPRMGIGEQSSTSLALVIHELATNSLKYGALSVDTGLLDISGTMTDGQVLLASTERGGPAIEPPKEIGYGSKLLDRMVSSQLRGSLQSDWSPEGAVIRLTFDVMKLAS